MSTTRREYRAKPDVVRRDLPDRRGAAARGGYGCSSPACTGRSTCPSRWAGAGGASPAREQDQVDRAGEDEKRALADSTVRWFRAHGYPFASARTLARVDSAANRAELAVQVDPGRRARGAADRGHRQRDDPATRDRPPAPGRGRGLVRRPRPRAGAAAAHPDGHRAARVGGRAARFGRRLERGGHARAWPRARSTSSRVKPGSSPPAGSRRRPPGPTGAGSAACAP